MWSFKPLALANASQSWDPMKRLAVGIPPVGCSSPGGFCHRKKKKKHWLHLAARLEWKGNAWVRPIFFCEQSCLFGLAIFWCQETPDPIAISPCERVEFKFVRVWSRPRFQCFFVWLALAPPRFGGVEWESGPNRVGDPTLCRTCRLRYVWHDQVTEFPNFKGELCLQDIEISSPEMSFFVERQLSPYQFRWSLLTFELLFELSQIVMCWSRIPKFHQTSSNFPADWNREFHNLAWSFVSQGVFNGETILQPNDFESEAPAIASKNYFTSSDPHRDIILKHIRHKFWHSFCPSVSRFHQNYPLLLVPSPGSGSSSDHCDLSSQTDSNWLSLCLVQHNFRRPGVSRRLGAWKLRFERYIKLFG